MSRADHRRLPADVRMMGLSTLLSAWSACASPPAPTGFISDYSRLTPAGPGWMRYVSPKLAGYSAFMLDPVQIRVNREVLDDQRRAEVASYFRSAIIEVLQSGGYRLVSEPGVGTARFRVAITDVQQSTWWLNLHPATKVTGVGRAGASMEAEVIDSVTGEQLAASIRAGRARQFELNPFETINDVKGVIDRWAAAAKEKLMEMQRARPA